jgi:hypothetical protein
LIATGVMGVDVTAGGKDRSGVQCSGVEEVLEAGDEARGGCVAADVGGGLLFTEGTAAAVRLRGPKGVPLSTELRGTDPGGMPL